jgi:hypothetical protein
VDERGRLDLVPLRLEAAQTRRMSERVHAAGTRREAPELLTAGGVEGVEDLARADEDPLGTVHLAHVHRGCRGEGRPGLHVGLEAPELAPVGETDGVHVAVPGQDVHHADQALAGHVDERHARGAGDGALRLESPAEAQVRRVVRGQDPLVRIEEESPRSARVGGPLGGLEVAGEERHTVREGQAVQDDLGIRGVALGVEADPAELAVGSRPGVDEGSAQIQVGVVEVALIVDRQALRAPGGGREVEGIFFGSGLAREPGRRKDAGVLDEDLPVHTVQVRQGRAQLIASAAAACRVGSGGVGG